MEILDAGPLLRTSKVAVRRTEEFRRIQALPRRGLDPESLVEPMTEALLRPGGSGTLRPIQALALYELAEGQGLFAPIRVGGGKTLISLLAFWVLGAKYPLLLLPAALIEKTKREWARLDRDWLIPRNIRLVSYELLGRASAATLLEDYAPDAIVTDESHRLKNPKAAVTRRVRRYMQGNPGTPFVAMSGTVTKRSLRDYSHLLTWALKDKAPIPRGHNELELWAEALDEKPRAGARIQPGPLAEWGPGAVDPLSAARLGFRGRLVSTPGVVATYESPIDASLRVEPLILQGDPATEEAFRVLRGTWETPDGWPLSDPMAIWRHARELALGFYYRWNPRPPRPWLEARKSWAASCREVLGSNRKGLDSELQVVQAVDSGAYPGLSGILGAWRQVKPTFEPRTEAVWLSTQALEACAAWLKRGPGLVWVEHTQFGKALETLTGVPYFQEKGLDSRGRALESLEGRPAIVSIASNSTGRNLQAWHRNLVASSPPNNLQAEQLIGRTHRDGQRADEVHFSWLLGCSEHLRGYLQCRADALYHEQITGQPQKLLLADDLIDPDPGAYPRTWAWQ